MSNKLHKPRDLHFVALLKRQGKGAHVNKKHKIGRKAKHKG